MCPIKNELTHVLIDTNNLVIIHSTPGYQSFLWMVHKYGKEWTKFTGASDMMCSEEMELPRENGNEESQIPNTSSTFNAQAPSKMRELSTSDMVPFNDSDYAPTKKCPSKPISNPLVNGPPWNKVTHRFF